MPKVIKDSLSRHLILDSKSKVVNALAVINDGIGTGPHRRRRVLIRRGTVLHGLEAPVHLGQFVLEVVYYLTKVIDDLEDELAKMDPNLIQCDCNPYTMRKET